MTSAHERKQQERQARRRRIQRAARTVFAEKGYAKTSIEQIAREASLSVGAIYLYFRSKEDLYVSLLEETLELFDTEMTQIRNRSDLKVDDKLRNTWTFLTQWAASDVEATRVLRLVSQPNIRKQLSDEVAESVGKGIAQIRMHLSAMIRDGASPALMSEENTAAQSGAENTVDLFWALFLGVLQTNDARVNLDLPGGTFNELAANAFTAIEGSLQTHNLN
ncbi:MAG: TetR/AcrR family transcriptional regulator [Kofleriaceae bacterium]|nr:TetR/AcrR family transcriptional regulator [Kofleriaceae bacterium]